MVCLRLLQIQAACLEAILNITQILTTKLRCVFLHETKDATASKQIMFGRRLYNNKLNIAVVLLDLYKLQYALHFR